ncbi:MAG: EamA family transporter [Thalassolituus sp.]|jgi:drug/metabolite transporter (DMT)-like permease|nr:MAG: EamA family transporter [Thalassolituus sp.]
MKIIVAYLMVVLIWSTTPVAIQLSQHNLDFFTAVSLRMWISALLSLPLVWLMRQRMSFSAQAIQSYLGGSLGIYGAMMSVYWGAAHIPSGLISVIYGLSPMLSGALAYLVLRERELTPVRLLALLVALSGLALVVSARMSIDGLAWKGIVGSVVSVLCFAGSAVWVKQVGAGIHPMVQTSGTLWVSSLLYLLTLPVFGLNIPAERDLVSFAALGYLIVFGSLLAFVLYFYILRHLPTSRVTLITLIAPVLAIFWGYTLRDERLQWQSFAGAALLLLSLAVYQWHQAPDRWLRNFVSHRFSAVTKSVQKSKRQSS